LPQLDKQQPRLAEVIAGVVSDPQCDRLTDMTATLTSLIPSSVKSRLRLMLTGVGIRHGEADPYLLGQWAEAAVASVSVWLPRIGKPWRWMIIRSGII